MISRQRFGVILNAVKKHKKKNMSFKIDDNNEQQQQQQQQQQQHDSQ